MYPIIFHITGGVRRIQTEPYAARANTTAQIFQILIPFSMAITAAMDSFLAVLSPYADEQFFKEHRTIAVYMPDAIRYYRVFAAYEYDSRHLLESFDFSDLKEKQRYIGEILKQRDLYAQIDRETVVEDDDSILTLSTGSSREIGKTYLVQAILEKSFYF